MTKPESLCWLTFLNARATAIDWLRAEFKYDDAQIATYLSMDPVQVRLIRERDRRLDVQSPAEPSDQPLPDIDIKRFEKAPCYLCGYSGPRYYQPDTHSCAWAYHRVVAAQNRRGD